MGNSEAKKKQRQEQQLKKLQEKQKLISIATIFLAGKDLQKVSEMQKKIFLRRKGLTEQMIQQAFQRSRARKQQQNKKNGQNNGIILDESVGKQKKGQQSK